MTAFALSVGVSFHSHPDRLNTWGFPSPSFPGEGTGVLVMESLLLLYPLFRLCPRHFVMWAPSPSFWGRAID